MVQFKQFAVFILLISQKVNSQLVTAESKKSTKGRLHAGDNDHFECDLVLLPQQSQMMYYDVFDEGSFDLYKWSKNNEGFVIVPYRISKVSHYRKCLNATQYHG